MVEGEPTRPEPLTMREITGLEFEEVRRVTGRPLSEWAEDNPGLAYVLAWLSERRRDSKVRYKTVLQRPLGDVWHMLEGAQRADPTNAESGNG